MSTAQENLDIRDLIRAAVVERGWSETEAARTIGMSASSLRQIIDGGRGLSAKAFSSMLKEWGIERDHPTLQRWLVAILKDRLGAVAERWVEKAHWSLDDAKKPVRDRPPLFAPYEALGDSSQTARRRLAILRAVALSSDGLGTAECCSAGWETPPVVENDLKFLYKAGLLAASDRKVKMQHPQQGTFQQARRTARVRFWTLTENGGALVKRLEGLPDLTSEDKLCSYR